MEMEETSTKLCRSSVVKRSMTHPIQRRRKWRRNTQNLEGERKRLETCWDDRELEKIEEYEFKRELDERERGDI